MSLLPNASIVEIIQLLLALVGVGLAFWKLWIAIENGLMITMLESTDLRRVVAETQILGELFRLFNQGCLVALGMISVLLPPPLIGTPELPMEQLQSILVRFGLITLTVAMVIDSLVQEVRRRHFLATLSTVNNVSSAAPPLPEPLPPHPPPPPPPPTSTEHDTGYPGPPSEIG